MAILLFPVEPVHIYRVHQLHYVPLLLIIFEGGTWRVPNVRASTEHRLSSTKSIGSGMLRPASTRNR
jgi:hypothetical protein